MHVNNKILLAGLIVFLLGNANQLLSQSTGSGSIKGVLADSVFADTIAGASITVFTKKDTVLVAYGVSKADGSFLLGNLPIGEYLLNISFTGFADVSLPFVVATTKPVVDFATIRLAQSSALLQNVVVRSSPVAIKGDTTEFSAASINTVPNASAEDLLKKIPGIEIEKDGTIKAQGEPVTRIFVDGKRFFGNDPKMATRNIPIELIDKIQIIDAQTDESIFNGFDDGERVKTINITTKKDRRKGVFAKASIAGGSNGRYATAASANRFNGNQQVSVIAQANNINSQNFSIEDFLGTVNTPQKNNAAGNNVYAGNAAGLNTTAAAGLNYNNSWGKKVELNSSYFYNNLDQLTIRDRFRETFVNGDSSLLNSYRLNGQNNNANHRLTAQLTYNIDSFNTIQVKHQSSVQNTATENLSQSVTTRGKSILLNSVEALSTSGTGGLRMDNSVLYRHRFGRSGRSVSINLAQNIDSYDRDGVTFSQIDRPTQTTDTIDQLNTQVRNGNSYSVQVNYIEPVSRTSVVEVSYRYNTSLNTSDQQTYRRLNAQDDYSLPIANLTNFFENRNEAHRVGASFKKQVSRFLNYSAGMGVQWSEVSSNNITRKSMVQNQYLNLSPTFNVQYKKSRYANFRLVYRGNTRPPSISLLQNVINNTNVTNIRTGNPNLQQEFVHNISVRYNSYRPGNGSNLSVNINGNKIVNQIGTTYIINNSSDSLEVEGYKLVPGAQFTRPENLGGAFDLGGSANYSFPIVRNVANVSVGSRLKYNRDVMAVNKINSFIHTYEMGGSVKLSLNVNNRFDLNFTCNTRYNKAVYENQPNRNSAFFNQAFGAEPTYISKSGWIVSNDVNYAMNRGQAAGFNQSAMLWNMSVGKLFLEKQNAELKLVVFDLLKQNINIRRNIEVSYVEDLQDQVLSRYFLLSFTYNLKNFAKAKSMYRRS